MGALLALASPVFRFFGALPAVAGSSADTSVVDDPALVISGSLFRLGSRGRSASSSATEDDAISILATLIGGPDSISNLTVRGGF